MLTRRRLAPVLVRRSARPRVQVDAGRNRVLSAPERRLLDEAEAKAGERVTDLWDKSQERQAWFDEHPEATRRLDRLGIEIASLATGVDTARGIPDREIDRPWLRPPSGLGLEPRYRSRTVNPEPGDDPDPPAKLGHATLTTGVDTEPAAVRIGER